MVVEPVKLGYPYIPNTHAWLRVIPIDVDVCLASDTADRVALYFNVTSGLSLKPLLLKLKCSVRVSDRKF